MSPIALGLDGLLVLLLLVTVSVGLRLNARLKGLRADHAGFAKAVGELDQALAKAQSGLAELRAATSAAESDITDRLRDAKAACARIDEAIARAKAAPRPQPQPEAAAAPGEEAGVLDLGRTAALAVRPQLSERPEPAAPIALASRRQERTRASVDEYLFEAADPVPTLRFGGARR